MQKEVAVTGHCDQNARAVSGQSGKYQRPDKLIVIAFISESSM